MYVLNAPLTDHYLRKCLYDKHARYSLGMCNVPFKGWRLLGCAIFFFWWVKRFLQFNGVPFQIDCNWASFQGVSYSFRTIGATVLSNTNDNWENFLFGKWNIYFNWMGCIFKGKDLSKKWCYFQQYNCFFWKGCDIVILYGNGVTFKLQT